MHSYHTSESRSNILVMGQNGEAHLPSPRWFAVWTRSKQEKAVAATLNSLGVRNYLPLKSELRKWSDRMQVVETPLFSGYLFVNISLSTNSRLRVLKVPGVGALVGNHIGPSPIPDGQIEDIHRVLTAGVECSVQPLLKEGDRVRVVKGPLAGIEGILSRTSTQSRLLVSVEMIGQSLSMNLPCSNVEVIERGPVPICQR